MKGSDVSGSKSLGQIGQWKIWRKCDFVALQLAVRTMKIKTNLFPKGGAADKICVRA